MYCFCLNLCFGGVLIVQGMTMEEYAKFSTKKCWISFVILFQKQSPNNEGHDFREE